MTIVDMTTPAVPMWLEEYTVRPKRRPPRGPLRRGAEEADPDMEPHRVLFVCADSDGVFIPIILLKGHFATEKELGPQEDQTAGLSRKVVLSDNEDEVRRKNTMTNLRNDWFLA